MYEMIDVPGMPGLGTSKLALPRAIWLNKNGVQYLPGGGVIDGTNARDPGNGAAQWEAGGAALPPPAQSSYPTAQSTYYGVLRCGLLLGKITASGKYGASVFGLTSVAALASATTVKVPIAVGQEIIRRLGGVTGSLTLVGPATAGGTVNVQAVTMTNCAATGDGTTYTITLYAGLSYALVTNSLVMPADGSQTIRTFVDNETGIRVTDGGGNGMDVPLWHIPFAGGIVIASNIVNYPADAALQTWVKAQLNSVGLQFGFSDNY